MLTIRMQRTGRKGLANYRIVVQDSRFTPTSGRVVKLLGHYNPHTKETVLDKAEAEKYLSNGAQPSSRVVRILKEQKVALPKWVKDTEREHKRAIKNPEKLRRNQEAEEQPEVADDAEGVVEEVVEVPAENTPETPEAVEEKAEEKVEEAAEVAEEQPEEPKAEEPSAESEEAKE